VFHTFFTFLAATLALAQTERALEETKQVPLTVKESTQGEDETWAVETQTRWRQLHPANWGHVGIFRIRSAESLPPKALTFGMGGEFYTTGDVPDFGVGSRDAETISESLFVGYSFTDRFTLGVMRRNSSTTFGNPQQLISSLGDFNFSGMYSFPIGKISAIAPIANVLIASNFNNLAPAGNTLSAGLGAAFSILLREVTGLPLSAHANLLYHMPQIRDGGNSTLAPEAFFNFSRYSTITLGIGGDLQLGDILPFLELYQVAQLGSGISAGSSPSKLSVGSRFTPLSNKSLAVLVGVDIGLGRGLAAGVPYSPSHQILGQVSYTVGLSSTERNHYHTTKDVNVVDRKFVIGRNINFKVANSDLESDSTDILDQIQKIIDQNKIKKLLIIGHTDSTHTENYNQKLSLDRASSVKSYLVAKGVSDEILLVQGYGKRKPRASNLTEEGRAKNRRVEFFILE
jgi:outer membrane protein OmpA-like peptidoglycan-associated protein